MKAPAFLRYLPLAGFCVLPAFGQINYPNFSNPAGLQLNGNAAVVGNVLRVTPATFSQAGSAFSNSPIALTPDASFSTFFQFRISNSGGAGDGDGLGADGIVFVVQTLANNVGGSGGGIGYLGIGHSVGIEYDTWNNGTGSGDPNGNHVNIDFSGAFSPAANAASVADRMNNGNVWSSWVDYDGSTGTLQVRLAENSSVRPGAPLLSQVVNLPTILGSTNAFVGFSSGTGAAFGDHDILNWQFLATYNPIGGGVSAVPEPATFGILGVSLLALGILVRRRHARVNAAG